VGRGTLAIDLSVACLCVFARRGHGTLAIDLSVACVFARRQEGFF